MINRVTLYLIATLFVMSLVPLFGAYSFMDDILASQSGIYKNASINQALEQAQLNLRELRKLDPKRDAELKGQFQNLEDLKMIYGSDTLFNQTLKVALQKYFFIGFGICLAISLVLGVALARLIDRGFKKLMASYLEQRDRTKYLEGIAHWQEVARTLAHEIRRPLMPIHVWLSNLAAVALRSEDTKARAQAVEAEAAMKEELKGLGQMVEQFSKFGRLPEPRAERIELKPLLVKFIEVNCETGGSLLPIRASVVCADQILCWGDSILLRQTLANLFDNAIEANVAAASIEIEISVEPCDGQVVLKVFNRGQEVPSELREKIFEPYYSTKIGKENMGLGLAIAKVQLIKQRGDIWNEPTFGGALFKIRLPAFEGDQ